MEIKRDLSPNDLKLNALETLPRTAEALECCLWLKNEVQEGQLQGDDLIR